MADLLNPTLSVKDVEKTISIICSKPQPQQSQTYQDILTAMNALHLDSKLASVVWDASPSTIVITFGDNRSINIHITLSQGVPPTNSSNTGTDEFSTKEYALIRTLSEAIIHAFVATGMTNYQVTYP